MLNRVLAVFAALISTLISDVGLVSGAINGEAGYHSLLQESTTTGSSLHIMEYIGAYFAQIYAILVPEDYSLFAGVTVALLIIFVIKTSLFLGLSLNHYRRGSKVAVGDAELFVSIIVPCYNEEKTVANCVHGLMKQTYENYEVLLVNDGSTDGTEKACMELASLYPQKVRAINKMNGGKASALRLGLEHSIGEIIVTMDADSIFLPDALKNLVSSFDDPNIGAVGGNVRVANKDSFLGRNQAVEYLTGLAIQKRAFAYLNCMQVIAGAIGAFRREVLIKVGGYSSDTIVEDMDVTVSVLRAGHRVEYCGKAIAYTEAPANIKDFLKQRYRWTFGGFQVLRKHWPMLFNREYGFAGIVGLPYLLVTPWIDVAFTLLFVVSFVGAAINGALVGFFVFYSFMMLVQCVLVLYAIRLDGEERRLVLSSCMYGLWYNHLLSLVTLFAGIRFLGGASASWNKMVRLGKNVLVEQK